MFSLLHAFGSVKQLSHIIYFSVFQTLDETFWFQENNDAANDCTFHTQENATLDDNHGMEV
jgi:hypothetical protein